LYDPYTLVHAADSPCDSERIRSRCDTAPIQREVNFKSSILATGRRLP
jgi:hypothetical protein